MANQYTVKEYTDSEIKNILKLYSEGHSYTKLGVMFNRQKNNIKKLLIEHGVWLPNRNDLKKNFNNKEYIEIKSDYTYDVLIGIKENRFTKKIDTTQYDKIKWVNKNIKPVNIIVVDKINNEFINKEIL